jgi:hypothetical protein
VGESPVKGKSLAAFARDIAEGYAALNPLVLKKFDRESYKGLHQQIRKVQTETRGEKFPLHDVLGIRKRNLKLQRLHNAIIVLEHSAREKRIPLN